MERFFRKSLFDFIKFYDMFGHKHIITFNALTERPWMMPHVIDEKSKHKFITEAKKYGNNQTFKHILNSLDIEIQDQDKQNLLKFLTQFSSRRKIDLNFLPKHFRNWCGF
jgi:hypothetical protein